MMTDEVIKKLNELKEKYQLGEIDLDALIDKCFYVGVSSQEPQTDD